MAEDNEDSVLIKNERDALHILPLEILPLQTPGLRRARMIKNSHLVSVVELFKGPATGSGQLEVRDLPQEFSWTEPNAHPDMIMLRKISAMPSYDVFSLRIGLRQIGIQVDQQEHLCLTPEMNHELTSYMTDFTRPLIAQIYGKSDDVKVETFNDVIALFRNPDVKHALEQLRIMADKLGIKPEEVPDFIEDYGDIFLSLSYYRRCLDSIEPIIFDFLDSVPELRNNYVLKHDQTFQQALTMMENRINQLLLQVTGRFQNFERGTKNMWDDISAEKFRKLQQVIRSFHISLGGILCSLSVKMDAWHRLFPKRSVGGPQKRAEFIMIEMRQGMENIERLRDEPPQFAAPAQESDEPATSTVPTGKS